MCVKLKKRSGLPCH